MARTKSDGGPSKMDMVRNALDELGKKAKPAAIHEHIKTKFSLEVPKSIISNYKTSILKRRGKGKRKAHAASEAGEAAPARVAVGAKGIRMEDLTAVRGLVGRLGISQVRQLVDVLA